MAGKKNQAELDTLLDSVINKVTSSMSVDKIILFGSYAKGNANDDSDIDIAVVSPDLSEHKAMFDNAIEVAQKSELYEPYVQLVAFPSKTYFEEKHISPSFIQEIKATGKVIYQV